MGRLYDTSAWRARPRERCSVHELTGADCAGPLHLHHVHPISEGGDPDGRVIPVCARHHRIVEALLDWLEPPPRRCPHQHRTAEARAICERKLNLDISAQAA